MVSGPVSWTPHPGYWMALKATLPLWRSNVDARTQWHAALAQRSSAPIIDPDLLNLADFADPLTSNPALALWQQRAFSLNEWLLNPVPLDKAHLDSTLRGTLGITLDQFRAIVAQNTSGTDITPVVAQLGLTSDAFDTLAGTISLIQNGISTLPSEQSDFTSILLEVAKERLYSVWRQEEAGPSVALGAAWPGIPPIVLGPDLFQALSAGDNGANGCGCSGPATNELTPPALPAWRATQAARQEWEDTLNSRIEQQSTTITALKNVVEFGRRRHPDPAPRYSGRGD